MERLQEATRRYEESAPTWGSEPVEGVQTVAFEDVSFAYREGRPVLKEMSFEVRGGETIGVIGPSGAGKSTLIQILLQLREPTSGRYLVNGKDADLISSADWHRLVAYVPQEPRLLHASVTENIRYFRDIGPEDVERAARLARIHDDITAWPEGYDTIVGPRADAISGGQQQRMCLARALAAHPAVLILDEPTSALDPHSERLIQESLSALKHELTLFMIAHRMSTLDICDRVMVVIDGRLAAFDTRGCCRRTTTTTAPPRWSPPAPAGERVRRDVRRAAASALPDFFIAGQPKSGTTALYEMLRRHPQIYMPDSKEPWFFAAELHERTPPRPGGTPGRSRSTRRCSRTRGPSSARGRPSALYLWSRTAAERIAAVRPDARIVVILREPASLLRSLHLQFLQTNIETESDLATALALEPARREGRGAAEPHLLAAGAALLRPRALRRAAAAATTRCFRASRCWC